jgi:hypothetical protein
MMNEMPVCTTGYNGCDRVQQGHVVSNLDDGWIPEDGNASSGAQSGKVEEGPASWTSDLAGKRVVDEV